MTIVVTRFDNTSDQSGNPAKAVGFTVTENSKAFYIDTAVTLSDSLNTDDLIVQAALSQLTSFIEAQVADLDAANPVLGSQVSLP